jgi:hypothetical protein
LVHLGWVLVAEKVDGGVGELLGDVAENAVGLSLVLGGLGGDLVGDSCKKKVRLSLMLPLCLLSNSPLSWVA